MKHALYGLIGAVMGCGFIAIVVNVWLDHALSDVLSGRLH